MAPFKNPVWTYLAEATGGSVGSGTTGAVGTEVSLVASTIFVNLDFIKFKIFILLRSFRDLQFLKLISVLSFF